MPRTTSLPSSPLLDASGTYARPRALLSRSRTSTSPMREILELSKTQAARFLHPRWEDIPVCVGCPLVGCPSVGCPSVGCPPVGSPKLGYPLVDSPQWTIPPELDRAEFYSRGRAACRLW